MKPMHFIAKMVDKDVPKPFFIIESYYTLDGVRSRICNGRFSSIKEAEDHISKLLGDS